MVRHMMVSLAVLLTATFSAEAQPIPVQPVPVQPVPQGLPQISGRVKSVHPERRFITLYLGDGKETTVELARDVKVFGTFAQGRFLRRTVTMEMSNGVAGLQPNTPVLLTSVMREGRPHVVEIRIEGIQRLR